MDSVVSGGFRKGGSATGARSVSKILWVPRPLPARKRPN